jgi:iron(III) transport system substrate-binding protein
MTRCILVAAVVSLVAVFPRAGEAADAGVVTAAEKEGKLVVYSTTDSAIVSALIKDFGAAYPKIPLEYNDMNSTELYNRFLSEAAAGAGSADLLWSSAMDLQVKLASDGYAQEYKSPEAAHLPSWAVWKDQAFGTTYEPIAFVYNKRLVKPEEAPKTHADLAKRLRENPARWKGKVTAYDPERSGIGFLLITQDAKLDPAFWDAAKAYGAVSVKLYTSIGAMLERITSGEHLLGFDIFGSYATARQRKDPNLAIVYPKDYTLVMSRVAVLPKAAKHPNAAKVFLDYLLSKRGQELVAKAALFSIRDDVQGEATASSLQKELGQVLKPIAVGPEILESLDKRKRLDFLDKWQQAIGTK